MSRHIFLLFNFLLLATIVFAQNYPRGIPFGKDSLYEDIPQKAELTQELYRNVGTSASLKKYAPTPGNQGSYGTCAAFACAYSARTIAEARSNNWTDKYQITQDVFAPGFIYRVSEPNKANCWGAYTSEILANIERYGVPKLSDFPSTCPAYYPTNAAFVKASSHKIKGYVKLFGSNGSRKQKVQTVKKSISEENPVVISMICPNSFDRAVGVWQPSELPGDPVWGRKHGRHAMCVVGYDDYKYGGAFEVINSWGTNWGNRGFIWITYEDFADFVYQAFEMLPLKQPKPISEPTNLKGSVKFVQNSGEEMNVVLKDNTYHFKEPYTEGTRFRIYLNNDEPAYVYAFGTDTSKEVFPIFPLESSISAALTYNKNQVAIPSEKKHIRLDGKVGKDYICIIYSKNPLNIENIKNKVRKGSGTFQNEVKSSLKSIEIKAENIKLKRNEIAFEAKSLNRNVVVVFMEIEHR